MIALQPLPSCSSSQACARCGIPLDAQHFDVSSVVAMPRDGGRDVVLARFGLPPEYCGVVEFFSQFTDEHARDPSQIDTPSLRWSLRVNQRPMYPYLELDHIVNPWGVGSFPVSLRLDDAAVLELVVRRVPTTPDQAAHDIKKVGGRVTGRYWYDRAFGDVVPARR